MNGRVAKMLRKQSLMLTESKVSVKEMKGGQVRWTPYSPKAIYKRLKRIYTQRKI